MKYFPLDKYRFYFAGNKIIACQTYEKKTVRGCALCHPEDEFNLDIGKRLAAARCNEKIAQKRYARAKRKYSEACEAAIAATAQVERMREYMNDSYIAMNEASQDCDNIIKSITQRT